MQTKPLLYGIVGFILGGLLVSIAATTFDKPKSDMQEMVTALQDKKGDGYDKAFVADMIEHHQAAVDMAKLSAKNAKHSEVKQLSQNIVAAQEKEIAQMRQWQKQWGYPEASMNMSH